MIMWTSRVLKLTYLKSALIFCILHLHLTAVLLSPVAEANPDAKRLYDDLLSNYNK